MQVVTAEGNNKIQNNNLECLGVNIKSWKYNFTVNFISVFIYIFSKFYFNIYYYISKQLNYIILLFNNYNINNLIIKKYKYKVLQTIKINLTFILLYFHFIEIL